MDEDLIKGLHIGSPTNPTVVSLSEFKGHRLLDIRKFYIDKETKTLNPTKKGVSLNATAVREIRDSLNANWDAIQEWLVSGSSSANETVERAMIARSTALETESTKARPLEVRAVSSKSAEFFTVESTGGVDQLTLNERHPFFEIINSKSGPNKDANSPLHLILATYYRAKLRFAGEIDADAEQFFMLFEHEWGLILKNYCEHSSNPNDE
jgi:hypothetical protein